MNTSSSSSTLLLLPLGLVIAVYFALAIEVAPGVFLETPTILSFAIAVLTTYPYWRGSDDDDDGSTAVFRGRRRTVAWLLFLVVIHTLVFFLMTVENDALSRIALPSGGGGQAPLRVYYAPIHGLMLALLYTEFVSTMFRTTSDSDMALFGAQLRSVFRPLAIFQTIHFLYVVFVHTVRESGTTTALVAARRKWLRYGASVSALAAICGMSVSLLWFVIAFSVHVATPAKHVL